MLFPAALEVDRAGTIPDADWRQMADLGLYGLAAPADAGGAGLGLFEIIDVIETMAAGCVATTFTWVQHHGVVMGLANTENPGCASATSPTRSLAGCAGRDDRRRDPGPAADAGTAGRRRLADLRRGAVRQRLGHRRHPADVGRRRRHGGHRRRARCRPPSSRESSASSRSTSSPPRAPARCRCTSRICSSATTSSSRGCHASDFLANQGVAVRLNGTLSIGITRRCVRLLDDAGATVAAARLGAECDVARARLMPRWSTSLR